MQTNIIYNEDCLMLLQRMPNNTINLIYIDPPFNCKRDQEFGMPSWKDNNQEPNRIDEILPIIPDDTGTRNYLRFMYLRIKEMHRVLRCDGSIYVHCDWRVNSYLRLLLDEVFGSNLFQREILWAFDTKSGYKSMVSNWIRSHDTIWFYSKNDSNTFNKQYTPYSNEYISRFKKIDKDGRKYRDDRGSGIKQYLDELKGIPVSDVWSDIMSFQQASTIKEYINYPTQKPEALLERIIKASSNEGDLVADFFCGSGTTLAVAEKLGRKWIGCDSNKVAVDIATERINKIDKGLFNETNSRR